MITAADLQKAKPGVKKGDIVAYIESMKVYNAITTHVGGKIVEICFSDGSPVEEDDVIIKIE